MNDYLKQDKKRKIKKDLVTIFILLLITLCVIMAYILYQNTAIVERIYPTPTVNMNIHKYIKGNNK